MKQVPARKAPNKVPQVFRLRRDLVALLHKTSQSSSINKTRLVEMALTRFFAVKN